MHIEITYGDGTTENVAVALEGFRVSVGPNWVPGHDVSDPVRCYFSRDFFEAALDEGHARGGVVEADEDEAAAGLKAFSWKLVGDEADACREKLAEWLEIVGETFDPAADLPGHVDPSHAGRYESDRQCWWEWLDDPESELAALVEAREAAPRP